MIHRLCASRRRRVIVTAATAAAASFAGSAARAQTAVNWVGAPNTPLPYVDPANWSSGVTPSNAANEFLMIGSAANNNGVATVSGTDAAQGAYLHLGIQPGDSGRLETVSYTHLTLPTNREV